MKSAAILVLISMAVFLAACGDSGQATWAERDESLPELLAARDGISLYDGAPPVIPHEVVRLGRQNCLNCHDAGSYDNGERIASARPHQAWGDCRQCHVERRSTGSFRLSSFEPLRWPALGHRQSEIAPPTIPHHVQNREECAICHIGAQAHPALRAAHGLRSQCRQCHADGVRP